MLLFQAEFNISKLDDLNIIISPDGEVFRSTVKKHTPGITRQIPYIFYHVHLPSDPACAWETDRVNSNQTLSGD